MELADSFGHIEVVLENGVCGLAVGAVISVDGLGWNSFLLEILLLSLKVLLHPGVLDDIHGGEAVVPLPSAQLPEEVGFKQPELDLERIVRQGPGRLHVDLAGERTVVGFIAGETGPDAALLALQDLLLC